VRGGAVCFVFGCCFGIVYSSVWLVLFVVSWWFHLVCCQGCCVYLLMILVYLCGLLLGFYCVVWLVCFDFVGVVCGCV